MASIMMMWGRYAFGINNAAFQRLERHNGWKWPEQELYGRAPKLQFTGEEANTITLPGVIYPEWRGGVNQINDMKTIADAAEPQTLIDGRGNILGLFVATSIVETQTDFGVFGIPRKQEFTISLKRFPDEISGNVGLNALLKLAKKAGIDPAAIKAIKDAVQKAQSAIGQIKQAIEQAQLVAQGVQAIIGAPFAAIDAAAKLATNIAGDFKTVANNATNLLKAPATTAANAVASANAAVTTIVEATPTLTAQSRVVSDSLIVSYDTVVAAMTAPAGVIATRAVMVASHKQTAFLSRTFHGTRALRIPT
jgi:phage protein U